MVCNFCIAHYLTQNRQQPREDTRKGFDPLSSVETGEGNGDTGDGDVVNDTLDENETLATRKSRYPAIDFFRGQLNCSYEKVSPFNPIFMNYPQRYSNTHHQ
mmetsp:Transcript_27944/g.23923  ORF Transcript_27944/g.23923 Transcript_27944/m.23923 type:complete len:102 (-) Transcript_27944:310-615(-)